MTDLPTVADLIGANSDTEVEQPQGDPDQVFVDVEHGSAPAATCPKPPRDE